MKCDSQKPYTCLGDSMWQGPKKLSSRATWADWTHWNKTVFPRKKMVGFIPPSWPIYTYIGHSILWVFWEDGEKRKKEKKRKSGKNKIDLSSILFGRFMLRLILCLFKNWKIITFIIAFLQNVLKKENLISKILSAYPTW